MKILAAIIILWIPFSLAAIVSIPVLLWGLLTEDETIWRPVGKAMDKLLAALMGYSGNHTLSAELGASTDYRWLRIILDTIQSGHCVGAARNEGLTV